MTQAPNVSISQIENPATRQAVIVAARTLLAGGRPRAAIRAFPCFKGTAPLARGIDTALVEILGEAAHQSITRVLARHVHGTGYLRALLEDGAQRVDLWGLPVEPVGEHHRAHARGVLAQRERREQQAAAAKPKPSATVIPFPSQTPRRGLLTLARGVPQAPTPEPAT